MERDVGDKKWSLLITRTCPPPPRARQAAGWFHWNLVSPPPPANNERRSKKFPRVGIIQLADEIQLKKTVGREEASWLGRRGAT